ncbi:MAG: ABC transporter ATP-binding protein [Bradymonadia bacterium]
MVDTTRTDTALSVQGLSKIFDVGFLGGMPVVGKWFRGINVKGIAQGLKVVDNVTFEVRRGEIFGFLGPNGAGKTTTIKMLTGLIHPSAGSGTLLGHPLGDRQARARLGFLPEHPYFYDYLKPLEFLDFYGQLFALTARERRQRAEALIERVGLSHARGRPVRKFSKGMIQRLGIAQALINEPDLVIFDEPMSGLDPVGRKDVRDIILDLRARGCTVFLSSHILQDVEMVCDRVVLLNHGRVIDEGTLDDLLAEPGGIVEITATGLTADQVTALGAEAQRVEQVAGGHRFHLDGAHDMQAFIEALYMGGGQLVSVVPHRQALEDVFVQQIERAEGR